MANDDIHKRRFEAAVNVMRSLPENGPFEPSDDMLVMFYSYYKQATVGPCSTTKPNGWDSLGKAKWEAWKALGNMSKEQAMKEYVEEIQLILEIMPVTEEVENLLEVLEPFYEVVENEDDKPKMLPSGSSEEDTADEEDMEEEEELADNEEELVVKRIERVASPVCNGISPTSSSTHSSLNTEKEEEELVCSAESSPDLCQLNDGSEDSKQKPRSSESDSDSMEHLTARMGSGVPKACLAELGMVGAKSQEERGGNREAQCGSQDGKPQGAAPPPSSPPAFGTVRPDSASVRRGRALPGCELQGTDPTTYNIINITVEKGNVNEQIAAALAQLQKDMKATLQRLNVLEAQATSCVINPIVCTPHTTKKDSQWWTLDVPPITVAMMLVWPFIAHWLVQLYLQKRRRRL